MRLQGQHFVRWSKETKPQTPNQSIQPSNKKGEIPISISSITARKRWIENESNAVQQLLNKANRLSERGQF